MDKIQFRWSTFCLRILRLVFGLFLYALGTVCVVQANIGLAPWDAWSVGFSNLTGLSLGLIVTLTGVAVLGLVVLLRESIGIGTILNIILIGAFIDLLQTLGFIPLLEHFGWGILLLLAGQITICFGSYFYIGAGFGCGPRDSLMVGLGKRLPKVPVGVVRSLLEGVVLLVGWLLGAKVGVGTVIAVAGIGFFLQLIFRMLRFDVKGVMHESLPVTLRQLIAAIVKAKPAEREREQDADME